MRLFRINIGEAMTKRDMILLVSVVMAAAVMSFFWKAAVIDSSGKLVIMSDGKLYGEYSLFENRTIEIETDLGYNKIVIKDKSAYMEMADCPDGYCMTYKPITATNQSIVCLPHRLVVQVENGGKVKKSEPDITVH